MKREGRNRRFIAITVILFAVGIAILCYPFVSNLINKGTQSRVIAEYDEAVENLTDADYSAYFEEADDYNRRLYETGSIYALSYPDIIEGYENVLNVDGKGMIGYVTIDSINVNLPIYHTSGGSVPANAAGHFKGTSFPVGGENTHAVISAHRGLPSARLFTDLDRLEIGDVFQITVLDKDLYYEVDQIKTVLPEVTEDIYIEDGEDYCTLLTCTPYGTNTERLLVRGTRTDPPEGDITDRGAGRIEQILFIAAIAAAAVLIIVLLRRRRRKNHEKPTEREIH